MQRTLRDELKDQEVDIVRQSAATRIHQWIIQAKEKMTARWLWELVQNAWDSTKNAEGDRSFSLHVDLQADKLCFQHSGGPFILTDLTNLICAGSLKGLEAGLQSGRFGKGFITTHILSETVTIEGKVRRGDGTVQDFQFDLNRSGTPDDILRNIEQVYDELSVPQSGKPITRFTYPLKDERAKQAARIGLESLRELIAYVMAFLPHLKSVELSMDGMDGIILIWKREGETKDGPVSLVHINVEELNVKELGDEPRESRLVMIKIGTDNNGPWCTVKAQYGDNGSLMLEPPTKGMPKLFCPFPLLGKTERLGLPVAIGGDFDPTEERDDILFSSERNKAQLIQAFKAIPELVEHAISRGWHNAHLLARVTETEAESEEERQWWNGELNSLVNELLRKKIVRTQRGRVITPLDEGIYFPLPLLRYDWREDDPRTCDIEVETIWKLASQLAEQLPALEIANDWQLTVREWNKLRRRHSVNTIDLMWLAEEVRGLKGLAEFAACWFSGDQEAAAKWLNTFFGLLKDYEDSTRRGLPPDFLDGLIPNQKGKLRSPRDLKRDVGIPEPLKDIAEEFKWSIRHTLFDTRFSSEWLDAKIQGKLNKHEVVEQLVSRMSWKEGSTVDPQEARPAIKLAAWMALDEEDWRHSAEKMPMFSDRYVVRKIAERPPFLPPVSQWKESELPFRPVFEFEKSRFLAESYVQERSSEDAKRIVRKLAEWGAVYPDVVYFVPEVELDAKELESILKERPEKPLKGQHTIRSFEPGKAISTIPFLNPELLGALGRDPERARLFLKFLLEVVITRHEDWLRPVVVSCSCDANHEIYPAEWLAHLRTKKWVPCRVSDEAQYEPAGASADTLRELLEPSLHEFTDRSDGIQLLRFLGFDSLELQIERLTAGDASKREELASVLVKASNIEDLQRLVQKVQTPDELKDMLEWLDKRDSIMKILERNRRLGRTIEEVVKAVFKEYGFDVRSSYKEYDFQAYYLGSVDTEDLGRIEIEAKKKLYLVEVKATRGYDVWMTQTQADAAVAQPDSYVLCVVDFGGEKLDDSASQDQLYRAVKAGIRIVDTIGTELRRVLNIGLPASENIEVKLIGQIRYVVKPKLWKEGGYTLERWIAERVRT